jgi:hypothetical protein
MKATMTEREYARLGAHVEAIARDLPYPQSRARNTVPRREKSSRMAVLRPAIIALLISAAAVALLWAVPAARAQVLRWLGIGAVRIVLPEATPTPVATPPWTPRPTQRPALSGMPRRSGAAAIIERLPGRGTLLDARGVLTDALKLPTVPADLGAPDDVFFVDRGIRDTGLPLPSAILIWRDPADPQQVRMSLHIIRAPLDRVVYTKLAPRAVRETRVAGNRAVWAEGPYWLALRGNEAVMDYLVTGATLIWTEGGITYRLESILSMDEAVAVAESMR